jgi:hypothetical protein
VLVEKIRLQETEDFAPVMRCVSDQLAAPLTLRAFDDGSFEAFVTAAKGKLERAGYLGVPRKPWSRRRMIQEHVVRLTDVVDPPVNHPPGVEGWFTPPAR